MSRGLNKAQVIGHLGQDPEARYMPDGTVTASFNVATDESYKDKATGQIVEKTEWHKIALFGRLAEIARDYLKKGSKVYVEGKLRTRKWQHKEHGHDCYSTEIVAHDIQMLDSKNATSGQAASSAPAQSNNQQQARVQPSPMADNPRGPTHQGAAVDDFDDDIPF
jgi:single-strand DNA-binding protein